MPLLRADLVGGRDDDYSEHWLQSLVQECPRLIPTEEIDAGLNGLIPVCMELPTPAGPVDNLFLTPDGNVVLVECKLWRNPEARRAVVAQIIDYAQAMSDWAYEDLELAAKRANPALHRLYNVVADVTHLAEADFVDAVTRNLSIGRVFLLIVGDGIRRNAESLAGLLQHHAGFHFTLALVEMPIYRLPDGGHVVLPRIIARTELIDRGVVSIENGSVRIDAPPETATGRGAGMLRRSISVEQCLEDLQKTFPAVYQRFESLFPQFDERGIYLESSGASLSLRWIGPDERRYTIIQLQPDGTLNTRQVTWPANAIGQIELSREYLSELAEIVGGNVRQNIKLTEFSIKGSDGRDPNLAQLLEDPSAWLDAIDRYQAALSAAIAKAAD
ncbi:hypothetical protein [Halovulum dunhuangense]|nr:hypothetical protein [Halovulum dunhuangense]